MPAGPIQDYLAQLHARLRGLEGGSVATYIPELAYADPNALAIAIATVDGAVYSVGEHAERFTIQSVSKPFVYAHVLETLGIEKVSKHVGVEPSGEAFNAIELDDIHRRAFNPMINTGAIATAGLIDGATKAERIAVLDHVFERFTGRPLDVDEPVFESERATGHRNRAMAWLMLNSGILEGEPEEVLELYFRQCSMLIDVRDLALMGATLANGGINPRSQARAIATATVGDVLTVMNSCGMYNYAGQWAFEIGLPAKSGVSGCILAVAPGQAGIAIWSPPIDATGTSVRGVAAARAISQDFGLRTFATHPDPQSVIRRSFSAAQLRSKRPRSPQERRLIDRTAQAIVVLEVQGPLFFASAERLVRQGSALAGAAGWVILDFRHVLSADDAGRRLVAAFRDRLAMQGRRLIAANLSHDDALAGLRADFAAAPFPLLFDTRDEALEHAEDAVLARLQSPRAAELPLAAMTLFDGLGSTDCDAVCALATRVEHSAGAIIARAGTAADHLFLIASGAASVRLPDADSSTTRVGVLGPGMVFGEAALTEGGTRGADVVADVTAVVYALPVEPLRALAAERPQLLITILGNVARELGDRLRLANEEILALER